MLATPPTTIMAPSTSNQTRAFKYFIILLNFLDDLSEPPTTDYPLTQVDLGPWDA